MIHFKLEYRDWDDKHLSLRTDRQLSATINTCYEHVFMFNSLTILLLDLILTVSCRWIIDLDCLHAWILLTHSSATNESILVENVFFVTHDVTCRFKHDIMRKEVDGLEIMNASIRSWSQFISYSCTFVVSQVWSWTHKLSCWNKQESNVQVKLTMTNHRVCSTLVINE
jgi:hypothetical protein